MLDLDLVQLGRDHPLQSAGAPRLREDRDDDHAFGAQRPARGAAPPRAGRPGSRAPRSARRRRPARRARRHGVAADELGAAVGLGRCQRRSNRRSCPRRDSVVRADLLQDALGATDVEDEAVCGRTARSSPGRRRSGPARRRRAAAASCPAGSPARCRAAGSGAPRGSGTGSCRHDHHGRAGWPTSRATRVGRAAVHGMSVTRTARVAGAATQDRPARPRRSRPPSSAPRRSPRSRSPRRSGGRGGP